MELNHINIEQLLEDYPLSDRAVIYRLYNGSKNVSEFILKESIYKEFQPIICDLDASIQESIVLKHIELLTK